MSDTTHLPISQTGNADTTPMPEFFRVATDSESNVCVHCNKGSRVTVVYTDESGEEVAVGTSWEADGDGPEQAEEHANDLNWAYDLGSRGKAAALRWLEARIVWLKHERERGGNFEYLLTREEEARHIAETLKGLLPSADSGASQK